MTLSPATAHDPARPGTVDEVRADLMRLGYIADTQVATAVVLSQVLSKPILVEGPAGTGKTELAKTWAACTGRRLVRLQCYEGLDESKALYEWNFRKQLLFLQGERAAGAEVADRDIFGKEFLLSRPLLEAISATDPVLLLIDEVDRLEVETEALLLEVLSDYQVSIPELGTVQATQVPAVFLTSNSTRELSEALRRRCLFLHIDYPDAARERAIIESRVPDLPARLVEGVVDLVQSLRGLDLKKRPSVSESIDWASTLLYLGADEISPELVESTINVLLKSKGDVDEALGTLLKRSPLR